MKVKNVYQNEQGEWHIEYSQYDLMGLAIRVYWGQFLLSLFIWIPLLILAYSVSAKSPNDLKNIDSNSNLTTLQKSVCN